MQVYALARMQGGFLDKGAPALFAADQPHGFELGIDARGRHQRQAFARRQLPVRGQAGAGRQTARADVFGQLVNQQLVAGGWHRAVYP
ncbi:hypothetical protein D3C81_2086600 [compost metagenome]